MSWPRVMAERPAFKALTLGVPASALVRKTQRNAPFNQASIAAVFRSVFYVRLAGDMLCVTTVDVGDGPISARTNARCDWQRTGLRVGQPVSLTPKLLSVAGLIDVDLSTAQIWQPALIGTTGTSENMRAGLNRLRRHLAGGDRMAGLGAFLSPEFRLPATDVFLRLTAPKISAASLWMAAAMHGRKDLVPDWAVSLLGAGPGLTPSGDDFLGGALIALHAIGRARVAETLWHQIAPHLSERTNDISGALLKAAALGHGSAAIHTAIAALSGDDPTALPPALAAMDRIGHSSGWDTLLGVVTVLDARVAAHQRRAA